MDNKETLKRVGGGVLNSALASGVLWLLSHGAVEGRTTQPPSQAPSPQGIVEELKGPMPSQQTLNEQVRGLASQGDPLQSGEREQTAEVLKKDIWVPYFVPVPQVPGRILALAFNPSKGDRPQPYISSYNQEQENFFWQRIGESFKSNIRLMAIAISPANPNVWAVGGEFTDQQNTGRFFVTKNNGQSFQEFSFPGMGIVGYLGFSNDGSKLYSAAGSNEKFVKIDVSTLTRLTIANNGFENFGFNGFFTSPNYKETLYVVSGNAIVWSQDGGENWSILDYLPTPINSDAFRVINDQEKDVILASGNGWLWSRKGGEQAITRNTAELGSTGGFSTLTVDTSDSQMKILAAAGTIKIVVGPIQGLWDEMSNNGLPLMGSFRQLNSVLTPDGKEWFMGEVANEVNSYGLFAYHQSQGLTGSWKQMVEGLEWKDPFPVKRYLPLVTKQSSGGW